MRNLNHKDTKIKISPSKGTLQKQLVFTDVALTQLVLSPSASSRCDLRLIENLQMAKADPKTLVKKHYGSTIRNSMEVLSSN